MRNKEKENAPEDMMGYIERIAGFNEKVRDDASQKETTAIINQLATLKLSKALAINQYNELTDEIKETISKEDFQVANEAFDGIKTKLKYNFKQVDNYMTYGEKETSILSDYIIYLLKRINKLIEKEEEKAIKKEEMAVEKKEEPKEENAFEGEEEQGIETSDDSNVFNENG